MNERMLILIFAASYGCRRRMSKRLSAYFSLLLPTRNGRISFTVELRMTISCAQGRSILSKRHKQIQTAVFGILMAPAAAVAQQTPAQNAPPPDPTPPPGQANPGDPTASPVTMHPVTVTGGRPSEDFQVTRGSLNRLGAAELMDVPQTVVVINRALMQSQCAVTMENALRNVPGVTIGSAEGGTIGTNINLNGFSARTDIYLDGMRDRGQYYRAVFALEGV